MEKTVTQRSQCYNIFDNILLHDSSVTCERTASLPTHTGHPDGPRVQHTRHKKTFHPARVRRTIKTGRLLADASEPKFGVQVRARS